MPKSQFRLSGYLAVLTFEEQVHELWIDEHARQVTAGFDHLVYGLQSTQITRCQCVPLALDMAGHGEPVNPLKDVVAMLRRVNACTLGSFLYKGFGVCAIVMMDELFE